MTRKEYKIAVFGGVITIISSGIYDYIKEKPLLSSLKYLFQWIWNQIFEIEIKIWQILIILLLIIIISFIIKNNQVRKPKSTISFKDYIRDNIHGTEWTWTWEHNFLENKWQVCNIIPICNKCGTKMEFEPSYGFNLSAKCPRCDNRQTDLKNTEIIDALIIDNIHQNLHLDKIKIQ